MPSSSHPPSIVRGPLRAVLLAGVLGGVGSCDFPSGPPLLQPHYLLPGEGTTLGVRELLPPHVTVSGPVFLLALGTEPIPPRTLALVCGAPCLAVSGQRVPKPAFTDSLGIAVRLPADVHSVTLAGGAVLVSLTHDFGFDPLRPPGAATHGSILLRARDGARVLGSVLVTDPFPSGSTLQRVVPLQAGQVAGDILVEVVMVSPAGGTSPEHWVPVNVNASLHGFATPQQVSASQAAVRVESRSVNLPTAQIDLSGVDASLRRRVRGGALVLHLENPFAVSGTLQLQLTGGMTVTKSVPVQPGITTVRVAFMEAELQSLLGYLVALQASGAVTGSGAAVTVRPEQGLRVNTQLELIIELG
jgi:hypothetical protein